MSDLSLYDAMSTLRAVRRLRPDPIPADVLHRVLEAATWAPSGGNAQSWRMLVVQERSLKASLGALYAERWAAYTAHYRDLMAGQPADAVERSERTLAAGNYLADHFAETPAVLIFCFNPLAMAITDSEQDRPSVVGGGSIYPAVQNALLAARAEGLGCVLTTLLCQEEPKVRELLEIPDPWYTAAAIPLGYPVGGGHGPIRRRPPEKMAFSNRWGNAYAR
jgi:nitroreductase